MGDAVIKEGINKIIFPVLALVLSLFIFVTIMEVALRVYTNYTIYYDIEMTKYGLQLKRYAGPDIGHEHIPNSSAKLMGVPVKINSDGLRDKEYPLEKNGKRYIFLGDSLTFGWGVEVEKTYANITERELSLIEPTEVLNFGIGNFNVQQSFNQFFKKGVKYNPDEIVFFHFINDAEPTPQKSKYAFLGYSRMVSFMWSRIRTLTGGNSGFSYVDYYKSLYEDDQPGWIQEQKAYKKMVDYCREKGIEFKVVIIPELHQLQNYPFKEEHEKIIKTLESYSIPYLDLTPFLSKVKDPSSLWVALDDAHPNAKAHALIADYSMDFIAGSQKKSENK